MQNIVLAFFLCAHQNGFLSRLWLVWTSTCRFMSLHVLVHTNWLLICLIFNACSSDFLHHLQFLIYILRIDCIEPLTGDNFVYRHSAILSENNITTLFVWYRLQTETSDHVITKWCSVSQYTTEFWFFGCSVSLHPYLVWAIWQFLLFTMSSLFISTDTFLLRLNSLYNKPNFCRFDSQLNNLECRVFLFHHYKFLS